MLSAIRRLLGQEKPASLGAGSGAESVAGDPRSLKVGDVVNHEGSDFVVEGTLRFSQGGFEWQEHLLVDGSNRIWLSVEDDEGELEVCRWERGQATGLEPGPDRLEHEGVAYELEEHASADFTSEGTTGAPGGGRAEYADYAAGERRLSFERYSAEGPWEVSLGEKISEHMLDIYPARRS